MRLLVVCETARALANSLAQYTLLVYTFLYEFMRVSSQHDDFCSIFQTIYKNVTKALLNCYNIDGPRKMGIMLFPNRKSQRLVIFVILHNQPSKRINVNSTVIIISRTRR